MVVCFMTPLQSIPLMVVQSMIQLDKFLAQQVLDMRAMLPT